MPDCRGESRQKQTFLSPRYLQCLVKLFLPNNKPAGNSPGFVFVRHALIYITDKQGRQTCRSELVVQAETGNARAEFRTRGHCVGDCSAREIGGQSGGYAAEVHIKVFTFHRPVWVEGPLAAAANRVAGHVSLPLEAPARLGKPQRTTAAQLSLTLFPTLRLVTAKPPVA